MAYLMGVDLGTSGTKTALFDETGRTVASCTATYPLDQPQNGWAEQDPADWWDAAASTRKPGGRRPARLSGVCWTRAASPQTK